MPRDISGTFDRVLRYTDDRVAGAHLQAERFDQDLDDIAQALSDTFTRAQVNALLAALDVSAQIATVLAASGVADVVETRSNTPPTSPTSGQAFLVGTAGTGAWSGQSNKIATWTGSAYTYKGPIVGRLAFVKDSSLLYCYTTEWKTGNGVAATTATVQKGGAVFLGTASVDVVFDTPFSGSDYQVDIEPLGNRNFWPTNKTTSGVTINCSASITGTVRWTATK